MTVSQEIRWQLAGYGEPGGAGGIGRQFHEHDGWLLPAEVWCGEGARYPPVQVVTEPRLFWRPPALGTGERFGRGAIGADMLGRFCELVDGTDEDIAGFARSFGPLEFCDQHRRPSSHEGHGGRRCAPRRKDGGGSSNVEWSEPIAVWREWSGRARALLNIAARHRDGKLGAIEDCRELEGLGKVKSSHRVPGGEYGEHRVVEYDRPVWWRDDPGDIDQMWAEQCQVVEHVEGWLRTGGARLGIQAGPGGYRGSTTAAGLFGALGLQLLLVLTRADGFALCGGCSIPFAPSSEHRRYCERCGSDDRARAAARQRRRRARLREQSAE